MTDVEHLQAIKAAALKYLDTIVAAKADGLTVKAGFNSYTRKAGCYSAEIDAWVQARVYTPDQSFVDKLPGRDVSRVFVECSRKIEDTTE